MRILLSLIATCFVILILAWQNPEPVPWKDKIQKSLMNKAEQGGLTDFVVVMKAQPDLAEEALAISGKEEKAQFVFSRLKAQAEQSQASTIALLQERGVRFSTLIIVNAIRVEGDLELIKELAQSEEVAKILENPSVQLQRPLPDDLPPGRDPQTVEWGIDMINADDVWAMGYQGEGVVIGGEDTGYQWDHPALISRYRGWDGTAADHNYSWHDAIRELNDLNNYPDTLPSNNQCGLDIQEPCDDHGHGTWTMGIMVGADGENETGVAPGSKWIGCRNMEAGWGTPFSYLECFEFFLAPTDLNNENPDPSMAPHVINNSWGCPDIEGCNADNRALLERGVDNLKASGVFVVVSAGNSGGLGCSSISNPAAIYENSFTVGATGSNDTLWNGSSRGPVAVDSSMRLKPNVVAPGRGIRSTARNNDYSTGTGTSGAGPFVAGTVALMINANPDLAGEVDLLEDILEQTADPKTTDQDCGATSGMTVPNNVYGYGRIDALAAVQKALTVTSVVNLQPATPKIYPNPVNNQLTIEIPEGKESLEFRLYDVNGRLLSSHFWIGAVAESKTLDISALLSGIYFYQLRSGTQLYSGKLVKQ